MNIQLLENTILLNENIVKFVPHGDGDGKTVEEKVKVSILEALKKTLEKIMKWIKEVLFAKVLKRLQQLSDFIAKNNPMEVGSLSDIPMLMSGLKKYMPIAKTIIGKIDSVKTKEQNNSMCDEIRKTKKEMLDHMDPDKSRLKRFKKYAPSYLKTCAKEVLSFVEIARGYESAVSKIYKDAKSGSTKYSQRVLLMELHQFLAMLASSGVFTMNCLYNAMHSKKKMDYVH